MPKSTHAVEGCEVPMRRRYLFLITRRIRIVLPLRRKRRPHVIGGTDGARVAFSAAKGLRRLDCVSVLGSPSWRPLASHETTSLEIDGAFVLVAVLNAITARQNPVFGRAQAQFALGEKRRILPEAESSVLRVNRTPDTWVFSPLLYH